MGSSLIQRFHMHDGLDPSIRSRVLAPVRLNWEGLGHLLNMNSEQLAELGLERLLTTSELTDYLGLRVQAIYDLRAEGRGPRGIPVGRELRFAPSDIRRWLHERHEPEPVAAPKGGEL